MQVSPAADVSFGIDPESKGSLRTGLGWRFAAHSYLQIQVSKTSWVQGVRKEDQGCILTLCPDLSISVPTAHPGAVISHPLYPAQVRYMCHPSCNRLLKDISKCWLSPGNLASLWAPTASWLLPCPSGVPMKLLSVFSKVDQ